MPFLVAAVVVALLVPSSEQSSDGISAGET